MVLIYIDQDDQEIKKASFEAISYGAALAKQLGLSAEAILLGTVKIMCLNLVNMVLTKCIR